MKAMAALAAALWAGTSVAGPATKPAFWGFAPRPPMGWNSWDCWGTQVTEGQVRANAEFMGEKLKKVGWEYVIVDIQWYEPGAHGHDYRAGAELEMDQNGRLWPAVNRFPSAGGGKGFGPLAEYVHSKGLKFGVHLLRGIPRQAVERGCVIAGTSIKAGDVADTKSVCGWNSDMYGVDMSKPGGQAYYDSVFALLASWGVDFVKVDDLSRPYHAAEIEGIRKAIDKTGRAMVLSLSPGETPLKQAEHVETHANMWRMSDDFWDSWPAMKEQFDRCRNWAPYIGEGHWPDADMLPLGRVRAYQAKGNWTHFTADEQVTLMTLWAMARSPLFFGGDLPQTDEGTLKLITNPDVIAVDQGSENNHEALRRGDGLVVWVADVPGGKGERYVGVFNTSDREMEAKFEPREVGVAEGGKWVELWSGEEGYLPYVPAHGARLYRVSPK